MGNHDTAKEAAHSILKQYKLSEPSLDNLVFIIKELGFDIIDYSPKQKSYTLETLIESLSLQPYIQSGKAFVYQKEAIKLLFVCETMSSDEKRYALAHELGHIICGHLKNGSISGNGISEEYEANEFAHYLLYPGIKQKIASWISNHKVLSSVILASVLLQSLRFQLPTILLKAKAITENTTSPKTARSSTKKNVFLLKIKEIFTDSQLTSMNPENMSHVRYACRKKLKSECGIT